MGSSRWSSSDWSDYSTKTSCKTREDVFTAEGIKEHLNPLNIKVRESRDSVLNPDSNAIIVGFDVTGSMGNIPDYFVKQGLGVVMKEIFERKCVPDPHIMTMAIGDVEVGDSAPLQVSQFEADLKIAQQLTDFYLEGGGGSNHWESYTLAWYFAAMKTSIDCFEKRKKKGYLFTIGDEEINPVLHKDDILKVTGDKVQADMKAEELYQMVKMSYHVFHVIMEQGNYASSHPERTMKSWHNIIGQAVLPLSDYLKLSEVIISAIEVNEGRNKKDVVDSWDKSTALIVGNAIDGIERSGATEKVVMF